MGNGDTISLVFRTPAGDKKAHLVLQFGTLLGGDLELWEDVTWTTNTGVLNDIRNRDRSNPEMSVLLEDLTATPAFTATDNLLSNVGGLNLGAATVIHHIHSS